MRYRALDLNGDYTFGRGRSEFLENTPEAVAQAVQTRLRLITGEWFLDQEEGTPYPTKILGYNTATTFDQAIQERILGTAGVDRIVSYSSVVENRNLTVTATISTIYGPVNFTQVL